MKDKTKDSIEAEKFVRAVVKGKNVRASKHLENIIKKKCAAKIIETLKN